MGLPHLYIMGSCTKGLRRTLVGIWARVETIVSCPLFHGSAAFGEAASL